MPQPWKIAVDTGGTFTDAIAWDPQGRAHRCKVPSSSALRTRITHITHSRKITIETPWCIPEAFFVGYRVITPTGKSSSITHWDSSARQLTLATALPTTLHPGSSITLQSPEEAPLLAIRLLTSTPLDRPLPPLELRLATTKGTNALLEKHGTPTALFITEGFGDLLHIRDQRRPDLFARHIERPRPPHQAVVEVPERLDSLGRVLTPLDLSALESRLDTLRKQGITTAAIALLHSDLNPTHERALAQFLEKNGFTHLSLSSELAPAVKILPRAETALINARLHQTLRDFIDGIAKPLDTAPFSVMNSSGGLMPAPDFRPIDSLFSGPAGGVLGAVERAQHHGITSLLTFDMGGTSTDVARHPGRPLYQFSQTIADNTLLAPSLKLETVAAGGGSICGYHSRTGLFVGPQSAGAHPGPACYGQGGPLTLTDVNLLSGRLDPGHIPFPIDLEAARSRLRAVIESIPPEETGRESEILEGFLAIANERMADAIAKITLREGEDPRDYTLVAFGGAGPQHACAVAERLGVTRILIPADAGILSAYGVSQAPREAMATRQILRTLDEITPGLPALLGELEREALHSISSPHATIRRRIASARLLGQETTIEVEIDSDIPLTQSFAAAYEHLYHYPPPIEKAIELVALRVIATESRLTNTYTQSQVNCELTSLQDSSTRRLFHHPHFTLVIDPEWKIEQSPEGDFLLHKSTIEATDPSTRRPPSVTRELFRHRFAQIVEEMGTLLQRTALSPNIKERADFSCALLNPTGHLIVNAPHIPVHLGALGHCTREVLSKFSLQPGDVILTNHPGWGGSHLPDITLLSAAYDDRGEMLGIVATRAHHAEIGGIAPGSMPAHAYDLTQEGVVIAPTYLVAAGKPQWDAIEKIFALALHPTRQLSDNLADLRAQLASIQRGVHLLEQLGATHGRPLLQEQMTRLLAQAARALADTLPHLALPPNLLRETLDDGTLLQVALHLKEGKLHFDFTGTSPTHPGNLNATPAIVQSTILYVLRLLIDDDLPLNEGLLENVILHLPRCFLNPEFPSDPRQCPAVVGGNVETSQRLANLLIAGLGIQAQSQGTMNNILFGDEHFGYYETLGGGSGAGSGYPGASAVHTHMTNTALTDPEILERRFPVRLRQLAIRPNSGGPGQYPGGDGMIREWEFLAPLTVSLLTQRRKEGAPGLHGGRSGQPGLQTWYHANGHRETLPATAQIRAQSGDRLRIETPGGGGWGK